MQRKITLLTLVLVMVLGIFGQAYAADTAGTTELTSGINEKIQALIDEDLVLGDEEGLRLEDNITRAEVVTMLIRMLDEEDLADSIKGIPSRFSDMSPSHWANGNINLAIDRGLTTGYPDGTFKPSNNITNAEVVTLLVRVLDGLTKEEAQNASWPMTYILKANELGILEDVSISDFNLPAVRKDMFEMVYNVKQQVDEIKVVGEPVEAIVLENSRVGSLAKNYVGVKVLKDQNVDKTGYEREDEFMFDISKMVWDGSELDAEAALGKVLLIYFDANKKPVKVKLSSDYSYVEGKITDIKSDEIEIEEKWYNIDEDKDSRVDRSLSKAIFNNREVKYSGSKGFNLSVGSSFDEYARVTIRNGNILFIEAFDFIDIAPVVASDIEKDILRYADDSRDGAVKSLTLKNRETIVLEYKDNNLFEAKLEDIKEEDIIHIVNDNKNNKNNNIIILIKAKNAKVEGEFEGISYKGKNDLNPVIAIGDRDIDVAIEYKNFSPIYSTFASESNFYSLTKNYVDELQGFYKKDVVAYVDIFGNLQVLTTNEADIRFLGVVTNRFSTEIEIRRQDGKVEYYDVNRDTQSYKLSGGKFVSANLSEFNKDDLVRVITDEGKIVKIEKLTGVERTIKNISKDVVDFGENYFYTSGKTVVFTLGKTINVMDLKDIVDVVDKDYPIKGYAIQNERDASLVDAIVITEYKAKKAINVEEKVAEIVSIKTEGKSYRVTIEESNGQTLTYVVKDEDEVLKIKNGLVKVGFIVDIDIDKDTEEIVLIDVLINNDTPVFRITDIGRGGSQNLNYIVLKDKNDLERTVWINKYADMFDDYEEGDYVAIGNIDKYDAINLLKVVKTKTITGRWTTSDELKVGAFLDKLNELPKLANLKLSDKENVVATRTSYDNLTTAQKDLVKADDLNKLVALEEKMTVLENDKTNSDKVKEFTDKVNGLPETLSLKDDEAINQARVIYTGLTGKQKDLVLLSVYTKLVNAEKAIEFIVELNELPKINELTVEDEDDVEAVRELYNGLVELQKALINEADIDTLEALEGKIIELKG